MTKASSKARAQKSNAIANDVGLDHSWAKIRSQNIEKMWREVSTDDAYALALAVDVIRERSDDMRRIGDTSYSVLMASVATRLSNIRSTMLGKSKRKAALRYLEETADKLKAKR